MINRYVILGLITLLLTLPLTTATITTQQATRQTIHPQPINNLEFTHTVFAEYATTTTCPYCPAASSQLFGIYDSGDYPFYYVSLVADKNSKIYPRVQELGVSVVPVVFFDGKYNTILGKQDDDTVYRNVIETAGQRTVPDLDINIDVKWQGPAILKISVTVTNNEAEEYNGHLRVYIVEPEARWDDAMGDPYHFGLLHIPIDKALAVPKSHPQMLADTYTFSRTWIGALHGFGDITKENTMVIATVFDAQTDKAVECSAALPTVDMTSYRFFIQRPLFRLLSLFWDKIDLLV
ncbi:MAG: glutaredoxin [Candidatus Thermoplasmatota archaeon]|nr:glutaredoxin [Candidatus Thermoplasmatota archaeon]MBU1940726.1 glutaredoxin [Candidatus Thermoplasmatota archaeon]